MKIKALFLILISLFIIIGCDNTNPRIYLESKYYNEGKYIDITKEEFDKIKDENYVLYTYNHFCNFTTPCDKIFEKVMLKYKVDFLSMSIDEYKKTEFFNEVRYAPSIIIVKKGKILAYLDANKDEDYDKYQNPDIFEEWIIEYVNLEKE